MIAVQNRSTVCTDTEVQLWTRACAIQLTRDVAPAWRLPAVPLQFVSSKAAMPGGAWPIYILDDADQQGVLGWHAYDGSGNPYGRVFARTCKQYGASVSSVLSHEASIEAFIDPFVNRRSANGWPIEPGDPVEADPYFISVRTSAAAAAIPAEEDEYASRRHSSSVKVEVSNFALPSFYVKGSPGPWDYLGLTTGPFKLRPGGYSVTPNGTVWGEQVPEWRKLVKITDGSRTLRVVEELAGEHEALRDELVALGRAV